MTDVEVAVGLWWEARLQASIILPGTKIAFDDLLDEVQALLLFITSCGRDLSICGHNLLVVS